MREDDRRIKSSRIVNGVKAPHGVGDSDAARHSAIVGTACIDALQRDRLHLHAHVGAGEDVRISAVWNDLKPINGAGRKLADFAVAVDFARAPEPIEATPDAFGIVFGLNPCAVFLDAGLAAQQQDGIAVRH